MRIRINRPVKPSDKLIIMIVCCRPGRMNLVGRNVSETYRYRGKGVINVGSLWQFFSSGIILSLTVS